MRKAQQLEDVPQEIKGIVKLVERLEKVKEIKTLQEVPPELLGETTPIGLVYGGVTKVKQYVFDAAKLTEIRGASALLDRINLVDLPAFFHGEESSRFPECKKEKVPEYCQRGREDLPRDLQDALIPELIIYATGGNILAFCPAAFVDELTNAIERRYTQETLTANSCAVGETFRLLEVGLGILSEDMVNTPWLDWYKEKQKETLVKAYFGELDKRSPEERFFARKNFNELVTKLAAKFNQRRAGNDTKNRPTRRYPAMLETHPYVARDNHGRISALGEIEDSKQFISEPLARKKLVGQIAKKEITDLPDWYRNNLSLDWQPHETSITGWISDFKYYLDDQKKTIKYYTNIISQKIEIKDIKEAKSTEEIGNMSNNFVAFIYADGNNMGGYIQSEIKTPEDYRQFSEDVFKATKESVYKALSEHLPPRQLKNLSGQEDFKNKDGDWVYPFEIITIGGDDVILIVPADKALEVARAIGVEFERILEEKVDYRLSEAQVNQEAQCHRYAKCIKSREDEETKSIELIEYPSKCQLSMSIGVLITSYNTPIYYMEKLAEQLLKSAKKKAKDLKENHDYHGGTIDFLVLKTVTMISSSINSFREEGLTFDKLKLYAAPYTLHEIGGLIETVKALHKADFPRSQLYQIRSLLEQGKRTAILNYRYFRMRLNNKDAQGILKDEFECAWCGAKTNNGNLAPWMSVQNEDSTEYETIWRDIVDLYPFLEYETINK
jgi:CRISPR-associated protein Cmr2